MSATDGPAIYVGAITQGDTREVIHATRDGIYACPQRRTMQQVSPWMAVERWHDTGDDATLIATEADLVAVVMRVPDVVRVGLLDGWRHVLRLRAAERDVVLGPTDWTEVVMPAGDVS
jgi:hypothetical protein